MAIKSRELISSYSGKVQMNQFEPVEFFHSEKIVIDDTDEEAVEKKRRQLTKRVHDHAEAKVLQLRKDAETTKKLIAKKS